MSEKTSHTVGAPCWVDICSHDVEATIRFYSGVLGWQGRTSDGSGDLGGYCRARRDDEEVAGVMPLAHGNGPHAWVTYFAVEDAQATATAVGNAGGTVRFGPEEVLDLGTEAIFADPAGGVFGVWQPGTFAGAGLARRPGAVAWNELRTHDPDVSLSFYDVVFGWDVKEHDRGEMGTYFEWMLEGRSIAGMYDTGVRAPDETPAHWLVYFGVDDVRDAVEVIGRTGGTIASESADIAVESADISGGRSVIARDPAGAMFGVIGAEWS